MGVLGWRLQQVGPLCVPGFAGVTRKQLRQNESSDAVCALGKDHVAPDAGCECGYRVMPDRAACVDYWRYVRSQNALGIIDASRAGTLSDDFGQRVLIQAEAVGAILPGITEGARGLHTDPPGTVRAQRFQFRNRQVWAPDNADDNLVRQLRDCGWQVSKLDTRV